MILNLLFSDISNSPEFEIKTTYHVSKSEELFKHTFECLMGFMENVFPTQNNVFQLEMDDVKSIHYINEPYSGPVIVIHPMIIDKDPIKWEFPNVHQVQTQNESKINSN